VSGNRERLERFIASLEARDWDGLITRVTDFWPEPYEPPPGREHLVERY